MNDSDILVIGNIVIDHNRTESGDSTGPGGSAYFSGKMLENLGKVPTIVTPYGKDFPGEIFKKARLYPPKPTGGKTMVFQNILGNSGTRKQIVQNPRSGDYAWVGDLPRNLIQDKKIILVAPIIPNITPEQMKRWKTLNDKALYLLLPQGFFRSIDSRGMVSQTLWNPKSKIINLFDLVIISEKDWTGADGLISSWSRSGPVGVITRAQRGCSVYEKGHRTDYPAYQVDQTVDSTGAGDIFSAAFIWRYAKNKNLEDSADFANACAGLSLRYRSSDIIYGYRDIINFMTPHKRRNIL